MHSYISPPRGTVFYHLINFLLSKSCPIDLLRKIPEIIENMVFSLIFVLQKIWYFFNFCFTENMILPQIAENQENICTLSVFTKMLFLMQWEIINLSGAVV